MSNINFVFFGASKFSLIILDKLIENGYIPDFVVTTPDKPKGRKNVITPPLVKISAQKYNLKIIQPEKLSHLDIECPSGFDLFIVASYGKIIPKNILDIPKHGTLNVHPSLLPKFRGPSPIQSFILSGEKETGVTIMLMDEQIDHGPLVAQQEYQGETSTLNAKQMEEKLAELGGQMLADTIPKWINGEIKATKQNNSQATFTEKITKEDGLVDLEKDNPKKIYRKFLAFQPWPGVYYFTEKNNQMIRVIITDMELSPSGELKLKKIKPEGKNEMKYDDFLKGNKL